MNYIYLKPTAKYTPFVFFLGIFCPKISPGSSICIVRSLFCCPGLTFLRQEGIQLGSEMYISIQSSCLGSSEPLVNHQWSRMSFNSLEWGHDPHVWCHQADFCNGNYINKVNIESFLRHAFLNVFTWHSVIPTVVQINMDPFLIFEPFRKIKRKGYCNKIVISDLVLSAYGCITWNSRNRRHRFINAHMFLQVTP